MGLRPLFITVIDASKILIFSIGGEILDVIHCYGLENELYSAINNYGYVVCHISISGIEKYLIPKKAILSLLLPFLGSEDLFSRYY